MTPPASAGATQAEFVVKRYLSVSRFGDIARAPEIVRSAQSRPLDHPTLRTQVEPYWAPDSFR